jgi:hypothetical protein
VFESGIEKELGLKAYSGNARQTVNNLLPSFIEKL